MQKLVSFSVSLSFERPKTFAVSRGMDAPANKTPYTPKSSIEMKLLVKMAVKSVINFLN
jgi:hypothetical protein